jgi:hypothetical protein
MIDLLVRLMALAALTQFGMTLVGAHGCVSGRCLARMERASLEVLRVDWRPISVFPEVARKFR